ncbi:hypothetical protein S83_042878, partial [Arachis hypogaea]
PGRGVEEAVTFTGATIAVTVLPSPEPPIPPYSSNLPHSPPAKLLLPSPQKGGCCCCHGRLPCRCNFIQSSTVGTHHWYQSRPLLLMVHCDTKQRWRKGQNSPEEVAGAVENGIDKRIVCVNYGGIAASLEQRCVCYVDNFSSVCEVYSKAVKTAIVDHHAAVDSGLLLKLSFSTIFEYLQ